VDRTDRLRRHVSAYRSLLVLYPVSFRYRFGREMAQAFRERLREERGFLRVFALWAACLGDLARSAPRERFESLVNVGGRDRSREGRSAGMFRFIVRRLIYAIPVLLISSILVFVVMHVAVSPTAGLQLNPRISPKDIANYKHALGLDRSGFQQYMTWITHFLQGNWGKSLISNRSVFADIKTALANTLVLGVIATILSLAIGVGIGVYSAIRQYSWFDHFSTSAAFVGLSIPNFWFALLLQIFFGVYLTKWLHLRAPIFYTAGLYAPGSVGFHLMDRIRHLFLPMMVLAVQIIAVYSRYMRASMLEVLHGDYLRTARAKGLRERRVIVRHAMRNALIPLTTQVALDIGGIAGGLIITETIFEYPGMGRYFVKAIGNGDYAQVLPWLMVAVTFVIVFNLLADIMYAVLDPRIRYA
jgi:peptide/nickel transport system permease protein